MTTPSEELPTSNAHDRSVLDRCVQCGYSLRGLPANHRCPECGLAFDAESRCWRVRRRKGLVFSAIASLFLLYQLLPLPMIVREEWDVGVVIMLLASAGWVAIFVVLIRRYWTLFWGGQFAAVLPDGLFVRLEKPKTRRIPWTNISRAAARAGARGACLFLIQERAVHDIVGIFRTDDEVQDCISRINARVREARGTGADSTGD